MSVVLAIAALIWIACGALSYGILMAYLWHTFRLLQSDRATWRENAALSCFAAAFGPIALFVSLVMTGFAIHGLLYRRPRP